MTIDSHTALYCVFGRPARHSLSPAIHNAAFEKNGINAVYLAFEPERAIDAVRAVRSLGINGASVTIPFKTEIIDAIDEIDPIAEKIGSVNTLVNRSGNITGYNTDGFGAIRALHAEGVTFPGRKTYVIGNGGSARAIAFSLLEEKSLVAILGRDERKSARLAHDLSRHFPGVESGHISSIAEKIPEDDAIIINTTPVGMFPDIGSCPIDPSPLSAGHTVFDIVYSPMRTRLIESAGAAGCKTVLGSEMLLYQGARQFELWTSSQAPIATMRAALASALANREIR
ncbi:MAG: shikimate dehydrogenase [Spirochaetota bacterium]|nr:shikimate dehydrogenase [Spirochaetota bacterium]